MDTDWINYTFFGFACIIVLFFLLFRSCMKEIEKRLLDLEESSRNLWQEIEDLRWKIEENEKT